MADYAVIRRHERGRGAFASLFGAKAPRIGRWGGPRSSVAPSRRYKRRQGATRVAERAIPPPYKPEVRPVAAHRRAAVRPVAAHRRAAVRPAAALAPPKFV